MNRILRNTFFTLVMIGLTALAIHWNREELPKEKQYIREGQEALAAPFNSGITSKKESAISLKVSYARDVLRPKQKQTLKIETEPKVQLEIVTRYPNGSINNSQTLSAIADERGNYEMSFEIPDYKNLGSFVTKVTAYLDSSQAQASAAFILVRWGETPTPVQLNYQYQYPLLP